MYDKTNRDNLISTVFRTVFLSCFIFLIVFILEFSNILSYLSLGNKFSAFPSEINNTSFTEALEFIKEVPFNKISNLEKWKSPIKLRYEGKYTQKDIEVLKNIAESFNTIKGFPGIEIVEKEENVLISYVSISEFQEYKDKYKATSDNKSFCRHYTRDGVVYKGEIVIINDGLQGYKNSVVLHEFAHLIGFYDHTNTKSSILNKFSPVPCMSATDVLAFKMVYNPDIRPKATYEDLQSYYSKADSTPYYTAIKQEKPKEKNNLLLIAALNIALILFLIFISSIKRLGFIKALVSFIISILISIIILYFYSKYRVQIFNFINEFIK